jgi:hypothetical protein
VSVNLPVKDIEFFNGWGVKWQWRESRVINALLYYLTIGEAPISSPVIPGLGHVVGRYTRRDTLYFRASLSFGPGGG